MRWLLLVAFFLVLLAGFQLFILTDYTDLYFAWTIQPPLTAAFLGGGYLASAILEFLASRKKEWVEGRIAVPAVFSFTTLTLAATLIHLNRFHFNSLTFLAQSAAWFWLAIYAIVPPLMLLMWFRQYRAPGDDKERTRKLPKFVRAILLAQGMVALAWGLALFVDPAVFSSSWPWILTPLASRAIGAWLIGIGVIATHAAIENDYLRIRVGMISYSTFGLLELVALLRYPSNFAWTSLSAGVYLALTCSILITGLYSIRRAS